MCFSVLANKGSSKAQDHAFDMRERGLTQILTYDHKHVARIPWGQIEEF